jgi:dihydrodipicolinate reductase
VEDHCLSFCADDQAVDLAAHTEYDRDVFLQGLNYLLEQQGKDTELAI